MGGGSIPIVETTNFVFRISYSTSCGFDYRGLSISKCKQEKDKYGHRIVEWTLDPQAWAMTEEEQERFREAINEVEAERDTAIGFKQLTKDQRTLSDIWLELKAVKRNYSNFKRRAEEAENAINKLHRLWDELRANEQ